MTSSPRRPVLAVFDGASLRAVAAAAPLAGYGGSIAALGDGFAVSYWIVA